MAKICVKLKPSEREAENFGEVGREFYQAMVNVFNKFAETRRAVAGLLPERRRQSAEKSGKCCAQIAESNEMRILAKTLNQ